MHFINFRPYLSLITSAEKRDDGDDDDEDDGDDDDEHDSEYDEDENTDEMPKNKWVSFDGGCQFFSSSFSSYIWCLT